MILTNSYAANQMSDLEILARLGDPVAQLILQKQSMGFATSIMEEVHDGADMKIREEQLKAGR